MKRYFVIDLQQTCFMRDTVVKPMTKNELRSRFWSLDDCRTEKYSQFTSDYIQETWDVIFSETN